MRKLRILCFGDSLSAGYSRWGTVYHPYSLVLGKRLAAAFPLEAEVVADGVPGQLASDGEFLQRMRVCAGGSEGYSKGSHWGLMAAEKWDWTVVLGGTNDLGYGRGAEETFAALRDTWGAALGAGGKVLALTVPECHAVSGRLDATRNELNAKIMGYSADRFYAFDLKSHIPYHSLSPSERERYWDDGLHLTAEGYDWMGGHVADALIAILGDE